MKREKNLQTSRRVISFVVIIMLAMFLFFILALIISRNNTEVSENTPQQTDDTGEENEDEELPADAVSAAEAVTEDDSRLLQRQYFEEDGPEDCIRYSLTDLTGDGFPELIMGDYSDYSDETFPEVVYYYSETEGVKMECLSRYYTMTLYESGIIEYVSGGVNHTINYLQFRQDTEEWIVIDRFWVMNEEDVRGGPKYYREGDEENFLDEPEYSITEEEFKRITGGYTQKPVELEWMPLTPCSESAAIHCPSVYHLPLRFGFTRSVPQEAAPEKASQQRNRRHAVMQVSHCLPWTVRRA